MILESVIHEWFAFRRGLRVSERYAFDRLMTRARQHAGAASNAARLNPTEALFMAILLEHEKELEQLRTREKESSPSEKENDKTRIHDSAHVNDNAQIIICSRKDDVDIDEQNDN